MADASPSESSSVPEDASSEATPGFRLRSLADAPVDDDAADRFHYGDVADGLALLIDGEETATPLTIAVSARWGAGKTSLLRLVENRLVRDRIRLHRPPTIVVWFNAWMHDTAPSLSAAMAADVARHATRCRDPLTRLWHPLPTSMLSPKERARRRFWLWVVALFPAIAIYPLVSFLVGPPTADVAKVRAAFGASAVAWFALLWGLSILWPRVQRSVAAVAAFVDDPRSAAATGSMTEVSAQLGELIREAQDGISRAWGGHQRPRFVVVVDDLERCQPPKAVDVCEVAAQLLAHPGVITVLVGDLQVIEASAELKYRDAAEQFGKDPDLAVEGLGRFFLQKVVQFELEVPPIPRQRLPQLARSVPANASIHGHEEYRPTPRPSRFLWLLRSPALIVAAVVFVLGVLGLVLFLIPGPKFYPALAFAIVVAAAAIALPTTFAVLGYRRRRIAELRAEVNGLVGNVIANVLAARGPGPVSSGLENEVTSRLAQPTREFSLRPYWSKARDLVSDQEIRRRLQQADEDSREKAQAVIMDLLPPLPRMTKRLLNRLDFLLVVAYNRKLIVNRKVSAEQLGKWAVLLDRWPEAARVITYDPGLIEDLEREAGNEDAFARLCSDHAPPLTRDLARLRGFFQTDPKLAGAAYHLVYLDGEAGPPAGTQASGPAAEAQPAAGPAAEASGNGQQAQKAPVAS